MSGVSYQSCLFLQKEETIKHSKIYTLIVNLITDYGTFSGRQWCFSFKYQMVGTEQGTLNVHVIRNGQMNAQSIRFTDTDDQKSFKATELIDIDGRGFADSDMVEVIFQLMWYSLILSFFIGIIAYRQVNNHYKIAVQMFCAETD